MTTPPCISEVPIGRSESPGAPLSSFFLGPPVYLMKALRKGERRSADVACFPSAGWSVSAARHLQELLLLVSRPR